MGSILSHLASIMQLSINVQRQTVEAAVTGKREHIYHAAMFDPHTAAELSLDEIRALCDRLIEAHGQPAAGLSLTNAPPSGSLGRAAGTARTRRDQHGRAVAA